MAKARARAFRVRRSAAFKRNVARFGLAKAKYIANIISNKQKGVFLYTPKDGRRAETYRDTGETTSDL